MRMGSNSPELVLSVHTAQTLDKQRVQTGLGCTAVHRWYASQYQRLACRHSIDRRTERKATRHAATGGGGAVGETCPHNFEAVRAPPPKKKKTLDCDGRSFLFLFVFARELGSLPKNGGSNSGSF